MQGLVKELKQSQAYPPEFGQGVAKVFCEVAEHFHNKAMSTMRTVCDGGLVDCDMLLQTVPTDVWEEADLQGVFELLSRMAPHVKGW